MSGDIFSILNRVIDNKFIILPEDGNRLIISEKNNASGSGSGQSVTIRKSGKTFCMSLDQEENKTFRVYPFFNDSTEGINSKNDAILFFQKDDALQVLLIELKSDNTGKYMKQLLSGKNFLDFLFATIKLHCSTSIDKVSVKGVLFHTGRRTARKTPTKRQPVQYKEQSGLLVAKLDCNKEYYLEQFMVS